MPKVFTSKTQKIGEIGENIATRFLMKQGYTIIDRNYTRKWGEIDIIAEKAGKLYFIEVKSVSHFAEATRDTSHNNDKYRPEDNMHPWKLKRLGRTIQTYLMSDKKGREDWQLDLLVVYLDMTNKKARVKVVPDIVL